MDNRSGRTFRVGIVASDGPTSKRRTAAGWASPRRSAPVGTSRSWDLVREHAARLREASGEAGLATDRVVGVERAGSGDEHVTYALAGE